VFGGPTFLNAVLLFGAAAFTVPLLIHLLHRTRYTSIEWGAMFFLDDLRRVQTRRIEWQSLLLLLIRCAIPILLAVCMARPILSGRWAGKLADNEQPKLNAIILDNTLSMNTWKEPSNEGDAKARFTAGLRATELVRSSARQSRWSIQPLSGNMSPELGRIFLRDRDEALDAIDEVRMGAGVGTLSEAILRAADDIEKEAEPNARIVVVSDFQKSMLRNEDDKQWEAVRERLAKLASPPTIVLMPIGTRKGGPSLSNNIAVHFDVQTRSMIGIGQPFEIRLTVKNFSQQAVESTKLILSVDDVPMVSKSLSLPAQAETQTTFDLSFPAAGSHRIEARIDVDDALAEDNLATWAIYVVGEIPVLVVDPTTDGEFEQHDSDFLVAALTPFGGGAKSREELFRVTRTAPSKLRPSSIAEAQIVFLVDVPSLAESVVEAVSKQVEAGMPLLIFLGDRAERDWYNDRLGNPMGLRLQDVDGGVPYKAGGWAIRREAFQHPALRFLNDARMIGLESLEIRRFGRVATNSEQVTVLMRLESGEPWLMENRFGLGKVITCTTPCDDRWTNWPNRPLFLPMIQQLAISAGPIQSWAINVETGGTLSLPNESLDEWLGFDRNGTNREPPMPLSSDSRDKTVGIRFAKDESESVATFESLAATHPGFYKVMGLAKMPVFAGAQSPLRESNLELESSAELQAIATQIDARIADSVDAYLDLGDASQREIWRSVLLCLLIFLFGELVLQRSFAGART
jgi:hypothetical protein